jgi:two-component system cell cycle response regulator DivK
MAGLQILVVEDNEMQSILVRFLLEEAGHTVQIAGSAEAALETLRSFSVDLILMDLQLPGMDGLELTRILRQDPMRAATPIIALTAYTDPSDLGKARAAGCTGSISKPIDTGSFARQVGRSMHLTRDVNSPHDSRDLLAEIRNNFLAEGLEQSSRMLNDISSGPGCASEVIERILHRWAGLGGTLGFPEVSEQARRIEGLLALASPAYDEIETAIEIARRRFSTAGRDKPKLPAEVILGLKGLRIGLLSFAEEEVHRIRSVAERAAVQVLIEPISSGSVAKQTGYDALVINECGGPVPAAQRGPDLPVPAIFIRSRSSLQSLFNLTARSYDFLIAPWDAEEVLIRLYRLIARAAPQAVDSAGPKKIRPRVLIADDDPDIVAIVSAAFEQLDMDCEIARSGEKALQAIQRRPPDAIILDINLLDLSGFEVLTRLRRNLVTKGIPVLLLTARGDRSDIARGFECGANDYVVKPFKPLDLVKRVDKMISEHRLPQPPR